MRLVQRCGEFIIFFIYLNILEIQRRFPLRHQMGSQRSALQGFDAQMKKFRINWIFSYKMFPLIKIMCRQWWIHFLILLREFR